MKTDKSKATIKFPTKQQADIFATEWSRYSKTGHIVGAGTEDVEVTIFDLTEEDKKWVDNYTSKINHSILLDELPSLIANSYKNPFELNRAIEQLVDFKSDKVSEWTNEELRFISEYSGYGGLEKFGDFSDEELIGLLYEYFTDDEIVKKMWALAYKYGFGVVNNPTILEPSVGVGAFLKYAPQSANMVGYDINDYSVKITRLLYPDANIYKKPFEKLFIEKNDSIKNKVVHLQEFDLVIGNPPYGKAASRYLSMGELQHTKASNWIEYFITRGLDLLKKDGLLIYIVGAEQKNGGKMFLDSSDSEVKRTIFAKATLLDAYRLPTNLFKRTGVSTEILIFKKK